jgi:hypothetical protein
MGLMQRASQYTNLTKNLGVSSTDGPSLEATWGMGSYDLSNKWYRFGAGQGLELNMFNCISKGSAYTIYMKVSLDSLNGWRRLISSPSWNENGVSNVTIFLPYRTDCVLLHRSLSNHSIRLIPRKET